MFRYERTLRVWICEPKKMQTFSASPARVGDIRTWILIQRSSKFDGRSVRYFPSPYLVRAASGRKSFTSQHPKRKEREIQSLGSHRPVSIRNLPGYDDLGP